jgi:HSP20 family protein
MGTSQTDTRAMAVAIDAYRKGGAFVVELDLPGADPDSIDLTVEKNVVTVRAERRGPWTGEMQPVVRERSPRHLLPSALHGREPRHRCAASELQRC